MSELAEVEEALNLRALTNRIVIKPLEEPEDTKVGAIYLPDTRAGRRLCKAEVISVGPRYTELGVKIPSEITPGDIIVYSKNLEHTDAWLGEYVILNQEIPMAAIDKKQ